jgi:hypothetical protein
MYIFHLKMVVQPKHVMAKWISKNYLNSVAQTETPYFNKFYFYTTVCKKHYYYNNSCVN